MATIEESIRLVDGMSPTLRKIINAVDDSSNGMREAREQAERLGSSFYKMPGILGAVSSGFKSMIGQFAMGNIMANVAMRAVEVISQLPGKLMASSDAYAGMQARLKLVAGSAEEASAMNDLIFQSALRARGSYDAMLGSVSKIAMTAKEAFPDPKEVVPFVEGIQKLFTIGGTGVEEQKNAMLQLTQALGSGRLQGDEFRSIAESAPMIEQMIAKEMGVTQGKLKQLGSQGMITAEVIKNAIFNNMDEINEKFQSMPMSWAQMTQQLGSIFERGMAPAYAAISEIINSDRMQSIFNGLSGAAMMAGSGIAVLIKGVTALGSAVVGVFDFMVSGIELVLSTLEFFAPALSVVFGLYLGYLAACAEHWIVVNAGTWAQVVAQNVLATKTSIINGLTATWKAITGGMTAAQWALNAALWANPLGAIIIAIGVVIGIIFAWRAATLGLREAVAQSFKAIGDIVQGAVNIMIGAVNGLIKVLNAAGNGINKVFGTNISTIAEVQYRAEGWGDNAANFVREFKFENYMPKIGDMATPTSGDLGGSPLEDIAGSGSETAANTGRMADSLDSLDEDLRYLRDMAEREAIDKYTTASITIEMGGITNQVSSDLDIDGVVDRLTDGIKRSMVYAAQEVHP